MNCVITSPPYWQLRDYGFPRQWGLEATFHEYLEKLWSLMDEIYRVLKDDGTVWINLGDSYGTVSGRMDTSTEQVKYSTGANKSMEFKQKKPRSLHKCQLLIPHRFAIGCIDRGWIVRNDIIWAKTNGMPESVTDRFSKKHEYIFLMVKQPDYYFDLKSIRDQFKKVSIQRQQRALSKENKYWADGNSKIIGG
ncbi:MAG: DNA-methyltransferase, partial [Bacteroidota bacterium]